jgi:hypothetical protein
VVTDGVVYLNELVAQRITVTNAMIESLNASKLFVDSGTIASAIIGSAAITGAMIQDAAITTAKIQDAAITTAKIGDAQIDTLQLADNAVTVPYGKISSTHYDLIASTSLVFDIDHWTQTIVGGPVDAQGQPINIFISGQYVLDRDIRRTLQIHLLRDGVPIDLDAFFNNGITVSSAESNELKYGAFCYIFRDAPGAGPHTYTLLARAFVASLGPPSVVSGVEATISKLSIVMLGIMK